MKTTLIVLGVLAVLWVLKTFLAWFFDPQRGSGNWWR